MSDVILNAIKDLPGREVIAGDGDLPDGAVGETEPVDEGEGSPEGVESPDGAAEGLEEGTTEGDEALDGTTKVEEDALGEGDGSNLPDKDKDGRKNRIPYDRVTKIVENGQIKLFKGIFGEDLPRTADGKLDIDGAITRVKANIEERDSQIHDYEDKLAQITSVEQIMVEDPARFLEMLPHLNPAYAELIGAGRSAASEANNADMPKPDVDLGNGQWTYSVEQMEKRLAWGEAQAVKKAEDRLNARLTPYEKQARSEAELGRAKQAIATTLQDARTNLEGFKENEDAIFTVMREDRLAAEKRRQKPTLTLERAYVKVMLPKWKADKQKLWAEWTTEQKTKKTSTSTVVNTKVPKKDTSGVSSGDSPTIAAIKKSIAGLPGR
jgi:hypothetical protein